VEALKIRHFAQMPNQKKMIALCQNMADFLGQMPLESLLSSIGSFQSPDDSRPRSPRLFIASNGILGLASPSAELGDSVVQFWHTTASAIVRKGASSSNNDNDWEVSGRAGIVREASGYSDDWDTNDDMTRFLGVERGGTLGNNPALTINMGLETLTQLIINSIRLTQSNIEHKCQIEEAADDAWPIQSLGRVRSDFLGPPLRRLISDYILPGLLSLWKNLLAPLILAFVLAIVRVYVQ
jgi:hypothetical protein